MPVRSVEMEDRVGKVSKIGLIGIAPAAAGFEFEPQGVVASLGLAVDHSIGIVDMMVTGIGQIFTGERSVQELGGPVKIAKFPGEQPRLRHQEEDQHIDQIAVDQHDQRAHHREVIAVMPFLHGVGSGRAQEIQRQRHRQHARQSQHLQPNRAKIDRSRFHRAPVSGRPGKSASLNRQASNAERAARIGGTEAARRARCEQRPLSDLLCFRRPSRGRGRRHDMTRTTYGIARMRQFSCFP
mgnify:CR=1 FL=1